MGILFVAGAMATGCPAGFVALSMHEPQGPIWNFQPEAGKTSQTPALSPGPYVVWVNQPPSGARCKLKVRRANGSAVGNDDGARFCSVSGQASAGEVWSIDSEGAPDAMGGLNTSAPVELPWGLRLLLGVDVLALMIGVGLLIFAAFAPSNPPQGRWSPSDPR